MFIDFVDTLKSISIGKHIWYARQVYVLCIYVFLMSYTLIIETIVTDINWWRYEPRRSYDKFQHII